MFLKRLIAWYAFRLAIKNKRHSEVEGILVYYQNPDFLRFIERSIFELKSKDSLNFQRTKKRLNGIIEFKKKMPGLVEWLECILIK